jgi:hypothetical protein
MRLKLLELIGKNVSKNCTLALGTSKEQKRRRQPLPPGSLFKAFISRDKLSCFENQFFSSQCDYLESLSTI